MKFKSLGYGYGAKSSARSVAFSISPELQVQINELSGGHGYKSNWVERWLWLAVGLQTGDEVVIEEWETWARANLSEDDRVELQVRVDGMLVM